MTVGTQGAERIDLNALVPAELKEKIVFEQRAIVLERGKQPTTYTLAAPKGWTRSSSSSWRGNSASTSRCTSASSR